MAYRIFETKEFSATLRDLGDATARRIETKLRTHVYPLLSKNSRFGPNIKRLRGYQPPTWRYRVSDYRFLYTIDEQEKIISMLIAVHRRDVYR